MTFPLAPLHSYFSHAVSTKRLENACEAIKGSLDDDGKVMLKKQQ